MQDFPGLNRKLKKAKDKTEPFMRKLMTKVADDRRHRHMKDVDDNDLG